MSLACMDWMHGLSAHLSIPFIFSLLFPSFYTVSLGSIFYSPCHMIGEQMSGGAAHHSSAPVHWWLHLIQGYSHRQSDVCPLPLLPTPTHIETCKCIQKFLTHPLLHLTFTIRIGDWREREMRRRDCYYTSNLLFNLTFPALLTYSLQSYSDQSALNSSCSTSENRRKVQGEWNTKWKRAQ